MKVTREGEVYLPHDPCQERVNDILALIHGALAAADEKRLLAHVEDCPGCGSFIELHELVDDEFHSYFKGQQIVIPTEIPKKVGIHLAITRKKNLARWLHELGRAIFFQQPDAIDMYHPGQDLFHYRICLKKILNICSSTMTNPYLNEVGLTQKQIIGYRSFAKDLSKQPEKMIISLQNSKEMLDRSLDIESDSVSVLKSISDYYRLSEDYKSAIRELNRALEISRNNDEKWNLQGRLALAYTLTDNFDSSFLCIEEAKGIRDDFRLEFLTLRNYVIFKNSTCIQRTLIRMDQKIQNRQLSASDINSIKIISKWLTKEKDRILKLTSKDDKVRLFINKYTRSINTVN